MTIVLSVSVVCSFQPSRAVSAGKWCLSLTHCLLVLVWYLRFDKILTQYQLLLRFSNKINIYYMMVILLFLRQQNYAGIKGVALKDVTQFACNLKILKSITKNWAITSKAIPLIPDTSKAETCDDRFCCCLTNMMSQCVTMCHLSYDTYLYWASFWT